MKIFKNIKPIDIADRSIDTPNKYILFQKHIFAKRSNEYMNFIRLCLVNTITRDAMKPIAERMPITSDAVLYDAT